MWDLIKDYLENNEVYNYDEVNVVTIETDGHKCKVNFKHKQSSEYGNNTTLDLWEVLAYVHSK